MSAGSETIVPTKSQRELLTTGSELPLRTQGGRAPPQGGVHQDRFPHRERPEPPFARKAAPAGQIGARGREPGRRGAQNPRHLCREAALRIPGSVGAEDGGPAPARRKRPASCLFVTLGAAPRAREHQLIRATPVRGKSRGGPRTSSRHWPDGTHRAAVSGNHAGAGPVAAMPAWQGQEVEQ